MPNRTLEELHLLQARSHVVAAAARLASQSLLVSKLRARGLDTRQAEACLYTMRETLNAMRAHKEVVEDMAVRAEADSPSHKPR